MVSEMIERVARALHKELAGGDPDELIHHPAQKSWEQPRWARWAQWVDAARAAIEAMREPTEAMRDAATEDADEHDFGGAEARGCWQAMIDAALTPPPGETK